MAKAELQAAMAVLKLSITSEFVPWSKSRNYKPDAKPAERSLNWKVTLRCETEHGQREILTADYSAGSGHCPSYKPTWGGRMTTETAERIEYETEHGRRATGFREQIALDVLDVLYSLVMDSLRGEGAVWSMQCGHLAALYGYGPRVRRWEDILHAEIVEQAVHFHSTGRYVDDQRAFVLAHIGEGVL